MIIDHIGIPVSDYARSKGLYQRVLAPLGIELLMEYGEAAGFGRDGKPDFWIGTPRALERASSDISPVHVAFKATSQELVDEFYRTALEAGARDNGAPGLRPVYHPGYYGAFVLDPDGHNIEAVHHGP